MMVCIMGKTTADWGDIYCLLCFTGQTPKSLKELMNWIPPATPEGCLKVGLDLIEARKSVSPEPAYLMLENFLNACRETKVGTA